MNVFGFSSDSLTRYIPNSYARNPMLFGSTLFDRKKVVMHGFGSERFCEDKNFKGGEHQKNEIKVVRKLRHVFF